MIDEIVFVHKNGQSLEFNTDAIPFRRFDMEIDVSFDEVKIPQGHGIHPSYTYLGKRIMRAEGDMFGMDSEEYILRRREMLAVLMPYPELYGRAIGDLYIRFTGIPIRLTCECTIEGWPELPMEAMSPGRSSYLASWKAFDPRLYEEVENNVLLTHSAVVQGRTYNKTYPRSYAAITVTTATAQVGGDVDTFPILTFTGPAHSPRVLVYTVRAGWRAFELTDLELIAGDSVVIDFRKRTAVMNGLINVYSATKESSWFSLYANETVTVQYSPGAADTGATAKFSWRNAFML